MINQAIRLFLFLTLLTGFAYPMLITGIAQLFMNNKANGSMIYVGDKLVGSLLIAQKFETDAYFWPRPSAINYNPLPSGGSNLGPTSLALKNQVEARRAHLIKAHHLKNDAKVPSDLLFASGSGIDPHLSLDGIFFQFDRVASARHLDKDNREKLQQLINRLAYPHFYKIFSTPYVNVLELNLALDQMGKESHG